MLRPNSCGIHCAVIGTISILVFTGLFVREAESLDYRLPQIIRPISYELKMRMCLDEGQDCEIFTAPGTVDIKFNCTERTFNITLNREHSAIDEDRVQVTEVGTNSSVPITGHSYDDELNFYTITLNKSLEVNQTYSCFIPFKSLILTNDTYGLYRGHYNDSLAGNATKNMATTFFEPFGGRRTFPCFDEPDLKAVFTISIARALKYNTLVNMDLNRTVKDTEYEGWELDHFNPSVPMSSYGVCIIVSDFAYEQADPSIFKGKPVKVWGTPAAIQAGSGVFAAQMGAILLNWYENYTGIPYALPKMDSIAIPQFAAGAMENWGLNTYRDAYLIYNPETDPDTAKMGVAETLSHELSHQWFGNLATCKWWDQMWLNEGLATFFTYKALVNLMPQFNPETRYLEKHQYSALRFDSNPNRSHPVVIPTDSGFDFFTGTSMEKGGALTRMMEYIFGEDCLQLGLQLYLERSAYKGAVQDDLFTAMDDTIARLNISNALPANKSVKDVMDPWTLQTGYPLLRIERTSGSLVFTQENIIPSQTNHSWWVPIRVVTEDNPTFTSHVSDMWMAPTEASAGYPLMGDAQNGWVIINPDSAGFYRCLYSDELYGLILQQLASDPNSFTPFTRMQIADDYAYFGIQNFIPRLEAIKITEYLPTEKHIGVLSSGVKSINRILRKFQADTLFKNTLIGRLEKILGSLQEETTSTSEEKEASHILMNKVMNILCEFNSTSCASLSAKLFKRIKATPQLSQANIVPKNLQDSMYCGIVKYGGKEAWEYVNNLHATEANLWRSKYLAKALGCAVEPEFIQRTLSKVENKSLWEGSPQNRFSPLQELVKSDVGRHAYMGSALHQSQDTHDIKLVKKVANFLLENY